MSSEDVLSKEYGYHFLVYSTIVFVIVAAIGISASLFVQGLSRVIILVLTVCLAHILSIVIPLQHDGYWRSTLQEYKKSK